MIKLTAVTKQFRVGPETIPALSGVDLDIAQGEHVSIVGRSGSGKTTLLNIIGCIEKPTSGTYELRGRPVTHLGDEALSALRARTFGFVFQAFHLLPELDAVANVVLALRYGTFLRRERYERARAVLDDVGLGHRLHHRPAQLSAGERQRVALARALSNDPAVILADEPTGNLDTSTREEILQLLETQLERGKTLIVVTHDPAVAARSKRTLLMVDGRITEPANGTDWSRTPVGAP